MIPHHYWIDSLYFVTLDKESFGDKDTDESPTPHGFWADLRPELN